MPIQLSYHSTGYIAGALLATGLFLYLISLRGKSRQTWYLAIYFLLSMCLSVGFVLRTGLYSPEFAKPSSYIIGLYTAFSNVALLLFIYRFPRNHHPLESRVMVGLTLLLGILTYGYYVNSTIQSSTWYNFETQFFEFQSPSSAGPMGAALLLEHVWCLVVIVRKIIIEERSFRTAQKDNEKLDRIIFSYLSLESKEARGLRAFGLAVFFNMLFALPYVAYTRDLISYATFQHILTAATGIQLFLYAIIYLNNSPQPTSFMVKLVGVALVAVVLILGLVNRIAFDYNESRYDQSRLRFLETATWAIKKDSLNEIPEPVVYIAERPGVRSTEYRLVFSRSPRIREGSQLRDSDDQIQAIRERVKKTDVGTRMIEPVIQGDPLRVLRSHRALEPHDPTTFFTTFITSVNDRSYEIGFDYTTYRSLVHEAAANMALLLSVTGLLLLLGFPLFLRGGVVAPLQNLLGSVRRVNQGDYETRVAVQVEDEIGFLSHWFNRMVESIQKANRELTEYADKLEERVKERTSELRKSFEEVQALKTQQDGDYWLMSLLIDPLAENRSDSPDVLVDFFIRQRKEFKYEKWSGEIGGDINVAHKIELRGKTYVVFINADAMGKSIQGAGGALVLGSVFDAIIKRTERSSTIQNQFPERWLKNAFIELSNVFSSFKGRMLVSAFLGLVDEDTGFLYYMQAEHPSPVLFNGGKPSLLRPAYQYPKLGRPYEESQLFINTLQLNTGDLLFVGSDGRDDILIEDERGEEYIQEDELFFSRAVVQGDADLKLIFQTISETGVLIDDISLIRIHYRGLRRQARAISAENKKMFESVRGFLRAADYPAAARRMIEALERTPDERRVLRQVVSTLIKAGEFEEAIRYAIQYSRLEPGHIETLFLISRCYFELEDLVQAIDFGERVRMRAPDLIKNLAQLVRYYRHQGDAERAADLLKEIQIRDPGHPILVGTSNLAAE